MTTIRAATASREAPPAATTRPTTEPAPAAPTTAGSAAVSYERVIPFLPRTVGGPVGLRRPVDRLGAAPGGAIPTTFGGQPAFVIDEGVPTGAYLVVADRYVVWLAVAGGTRADLDAFVNAMDLEGLSRRR